MKKDLAFSIFALCVATLALAFSLVTQAHAQPIPAANGSYTGVVGTAPYLGSPKGFCTLSVTTASAVALSSCSGGIPANTRVAYIISESGAVRWRDDGTAPTTSTGYPMNANVQLVYAVAPFTAWQVIAQTATTAVDVQFYQ